MRSVPLIEYVPTYRKGARREREMNVMKYILWMLTSENMAARLAVPQRALG